ncbi:MAG: MFS transporter [Sulfobacillus acidophilus]|uniref:MFS transporter n=1 Tax=Sulfobacillus acidophilus TaxID=53633 RepID=A0A2T2WIV1_9FIRM|nr:MAG: MFS transporter [Sulfobacillus acidophilus]
MASATSRHVAAHHGIDYKWIALSNTTLGILMAAINGTSLIIALPAVFRGIHVNPLAPGATGLLLWVLLGFNVATTILLVAFGRVSDSYGRVRLYNLGFAVFTIGSILLSITWATGVAGEWQLIIFRFIQGIGGAFLFANSAAILTDAFPTNERGFALGLNQIAGIGGGVIGIVLGGLMAAVDWRAVFLINVPIGLAGTIWAYVALRETSSKRPALRMDWAGNITFAAGLLGVLIGLTYSIEPYKHYATGWHSPFVLTSLIAGIVLLIAFVVVEQFAPDPMFNLKLFRNQAFTAGNVAGLLAAVARGGLMFMIIIWLQGIWLPVHGVSYAHTPLQAGIDTLPQMVGFLLAGPISGRLSDRFGARWFGMAGMLVSGSGFLLLNTLHAIFPYWTFAFYVFLIGVGMGLFASPNSAAIMNSVPARYRGVASGMRATFMNAGQMLSMGIFFTIVITVLTTRLPGALYRGLIRVHFPAAIAAPISHLPPISALFSALLGYNPMKILLGAKGLAILPAASRAVVVGRSFFPGLIAAPFMHALSVVFLFAMGMSIIAAIASLLRGPHFIYDETQAAAGSAGPASQPTSERRRSEAVLLALAAVWMAKDGVEAHASPEREQQLRRALTLLALTLGQGRTHVQDRARPVDKPLASEG